MSAGRASEGMGWITWWGFSPARDLRMAGPVRQEGEVNILLVGSADPRHILKTIAGLKDTDLLHVWVIENSMEVVARHLLLLFLALVPQKYMGLNEKTEIFLEVFGNSEIRSQTEETLKAAATQLCLSVTDTPETDIHPCLDTTLLKFKEQDELNRILKLWVKPQLSSAPSSMTKAWDYRVRQHLGTRYDSKKGCFDWDLTMKLYEKGCGIIDKQQYARWRERGLAFEMRECVYDVINPTLLSLRVLGHKGDKVGVTGYWGDIVSSPYLSFGIESGHQSLFKTENGQHIKTAQDVSFTNVQAFLQSLISRRSCLMKCQSDAKSADQSPPPERCHGSVSIKDLIQLEGVSVTFLPLDSLHKLPEKTKYSQLFNTIYFSASSVHQLNPTLKQIAAPDAVLVVELAKYILELNKRQEADFESKVVNIAQEAGFEPWQEAGDDVHVVFIPHKE
ncbi:dynein assembly factor 3, axonemal-like [Thalassophryne amazonica]|uniref:dynein assembly factor 3, axonemal-like n=1 Tax=Thalassophryne amazonica TaxID=390379 RepID=UPI00147195CE|nr:dynein assembly factor 3, axonemal-like [Thalassophryne amazonica]